MKKILLVSFTLFALVQLSSAATLRVATYNIRNENTHDNAAGNGWATRCPVITSLVQFHDFDIFGTQEGKIGQLQDMQKNLSDYAYIGKGRDDGAEKGEFAAIFYKTDKFKLLDQGTFWISPVTDKPNKGWDAALPRVCTWGKFSDVKSDKIFYFFNLHMDHKGDKARSEGSLLVLEKIKQITNGGHNIILVGDFNMNPSAAGYLSLVNSGALRDARENATVRYETNGTFNDFKADGYSDERIDYIFTSAGFSVLRYGVLTDSYRSKKSDGKYTARMPSDHFSILVQLEY